uniref:protein phosphatase Slingshot homolog 2-like n=1 Tax=Oncorhynchus gorbuscha TaxID=8017 RepID=UPI001EAEB025|nr:protein phosphatase Slingshot homolog 2-like [Oncorhynchus gorbuscha]
MAENMAERVGGGTVCFCSALSPSDLLFPLLFLSYTALPQGQQTGRFHHNQKDCIGCCESILTLFLRPVSPSCPSLSLSSISESFLTVKGAALFLPRGNGSSPTSASRFAQLRSKHAGDLQQHLQTMFTLLRPEDNIKLAVRLESTVYQGTRYMVVVSTNGRQDTEESLVLGMDFSPADSSCSVGLVLPLWSDSLIHLDGDG